jgi:hypothetical protein
MVDCDIVVFKNPSFDCSVFVTNVPITVGEDTLADVFGVCGLIHGVHKFDPDNMKRKPDQIVPTTCASVKYYTQAAAKRAIAELNHYNFDGVAIKVSPSKPMKEAYARDLSFPKTVDVCNHFLGFHKWSTRVVFMHKRAHTEITNDTNVSRAIKDEINSNTNTNAPVVKSEFAVEEGEEYKDKPTITIEFECQIELKLDGQKVTGAGSGKRAGRFAPKVYEIARKLSIANARKNAFSKCVLMVLNNGKVRVHVNDEEERERLRLQEEEEGELDPKAILASLNVCTIENMQQQGVAEGVT